MTEVLHINEIGKVFGSIEISRRFRLISALLKFDKGWLMNGQATRWVPTTASVTKLDALTRRFILLLLNAIRLVVRMTFLTFQQG